jgi:hypothetical protein
MLIRSVIPSHVSLVPQMAASVALGLHLLQRIFVLLQDPLLHQIRRRRSALQPLLQAIRSHVALEFLLVALQGGRGGGVGEDVT